MKIEDRIAGFVADLEVAHVPHAAQEAASVLLLDASACMLAGLGETLTERLRAQIVARGGIRESSLVGADTKVPAPQAALYNGTLAHWSEWDDTFDPGAVHGGAVIFPTLLATAEACGTTDADRFLAATVAAYEVSCRIGGMLWLHAHPGWWPTGIAGLVGAAAGAAKLAGLDRLGIRHAMGLATSIAGSGRQPILERASAKNVFAGVAALQAITALDLARAGVHAPQEFLAGAFGLKALLAPDVDLAAAEAALSQRWDITAISLKPWPACRSTHGGIEMALDLAADGVKPAAIERIDLAVSQIMFDLVGKPFAPEPEPRVAAQFSLPYTVALALTHGRVGLDQFRAEQVLNDQPVRDLAARVTVRCHGEHVFRQRIAVQLTDGRVVERRLGDLKGMPERPLSAAELHRKLEDTATGKLPASAVAQIEQACARIEVESLLDALRAASA